MSGDVLRAGRIHLTRVCPLFQPSQVKHHLPQRRGEISMSGERGSRLRSQTVGEVTVRLEEEEEEMNQELVSEPLPEPLLIILSPPPPFLPAPGEPSMFWPKWLKAFEHYMEALGEHQLVDSTKCLLLQNCLGPEGQRIYSTLIPSTASYAAAVSALSLHFSSSHTSQACRLHFHQRAQMPGETVDQFVCALQELLKPCNYRDTHSKLILDQLIEKTNCVKLRERLLSEQDTLTLDKALLIGKEVESALSESRLFGIHEVSVEIGDDLDPPVERKTKRGRPRRGKRSPENKTKVTQSSTSTESELCDSAAATSQTPSQSSNDTIHENEPLLASQRLEESSCDGASDSVEEEEGGEDFVVSSDKLKGPYCPVCPDRRFRDANKLARHMRTHTKEKPFRCPVCTLAFSQSYHMTRHLRNQHGAGLHVCPTCGDSLGSALELQNHKRTHISDARTCPTCQEKFTDSHAFLSHISSHGQSQTEGQHSQQSRDRNQETVRSCNEGDSTAAGNDSDSGNSDSLNKESDAGVRTQDKNAADASSQDEGSQKETSKTKAHCCPICVGRHFRGPNKLARHMRTHTKEKPFSCPICAKTFSQSYHMTRHQRNQHNVGQYICAKCGKSSSSWLELKAHKRTHVVEDLTCLACEKQFKEKAALITHLKQHKKLRASPRSLVCDDCGKVFRRMYHLKRHIVTHGKGGSGEQYTCPDCHRNFAFPSDLNRHLQVHSKENSGTCPKCNEVLGSPEELDAHMKVHEKSYTCSICGKKFKVEYALKKHEQGHQNEQYYCSLCCKRFIKLSHYKRHVMVHNRRESRCPHCNAVFLQLTALKYHLRTHTEERPHQCTCCIETFETKEDLEQHRLKHRKFKAERPYSCTRCSQAFLTLPELTQHMSSHEGEQPQHCPVCGKTFLNKTKLKKHLSIHTGERPHLCSVCGNGFPSAASLKLHVHVHTGEKPFKCSQCSKSFSSSSGLRLHSRQHMEVRPSYKCPECGRSYGRMTELKMHQRYHTGDKPYACIYCNKCFISKDKLNVHMRVHTGERPYSCPHCGQTFTQTGDRNRHITKYH